MPTFTASDGTEIHYAESGSGSSVLLFVHGWCASQSIWQAQREYFADRNRVICVDRRGYGGSGFAADNNDGKRQAKDLQELLFHLGVSRVALVTHGGGVTTSIQFTVDFPRLVEALVVIDANILNIDSLDDPNSPAAVNLKYEIETLQKQGTGKSLAELMNRYFHDATSAEKRAAYLAEVEQLSVEVAIADLHANVLNTEKLGRCIQCPVCWVSVGPVDNGYLSSVFANICFTTLEQSGHLAPLEVPEQINTALENFLVRE